MKIANRILPWLLVPGLLASCSGSAKLRTIDNAMLSMVPESAMGPISEARAKRDAAEDALAVAKRNLKLAEEEEDLSRASLKRYKARYEEAEVAMKIAEEDGTALRIQDASHEYSYAAARSEQARTGLIAAERGLSRSELALKTSEEAHRHALTRVELEKATALQSVDRGDARAVEIEEFRKQFETSDKKLKKLRDKLERADRRYVEAQEEWEAALQEAQELEQRLQPAAPQVAPQAEQQPELMELPPAAPAESSPE